MYVRANTPTPAWWHPARLPRMIATVVLRVEKDTPCHWGTETSALFFARLVVPTVLVLGSPLSSPSHQTPDSPTATPPRSGASASLHDVSTGKKASETNARALGTLRTHALPRTPMAHNSFYTRQAQEDALVTQITNPNRVGSGFIDLGPQKRFASAAPNWQTSGLKGSAPPPLTDVLNAPRPSSTGAQPPPAAQKPKAAKPAKGRQRPPRSPRPQGPKADKADKADKVAKVDKVDEVARSLHSSRSSSRTKRSRASCRRR